MSDGAKSWADDLESERYEANNKKDTEKLHAYIESKEFKRLVELRIKYKELRELDQLDHNAEIMINQCDCATNKWDLQQVIRNLGKELI